MHTYGRAPFLREAVVDIDAAVVGVSSARWTSISAAEANVDNAARVMSDHRFDILPIEFDEGVKEYFHTAIWGDYSTVIRGILGDHPKAATCGHLKTGHSE